jgi:hypothetical protein
MTAGAFVKDDTSIRRHDLDRRKPAMRAGKDRLKDQRRLHRVHLTRQVDRDRRPGRTPAVEVRVEPRIGPHLTRSLDRPFAHAHQISAMRQRTHQIINREL